MNFYKSLMQNFKALLYFTKIENNVLNNHIPIKK